MSKIVIPLLHIKNQASDKQVDAEQKTSVVNTMERESRTVMSINKDVSKNPMASYVVKGVCQPYIAITIMNMLCGARYVPHTQITDEYYVTHVLKRFDFFDYDGEYLYAMQESIVQFLQMTTQDVSAMRLGIALDTVIGTIHTFFLEGAMIPHQANVYKMACPPSLIPIKDMRYIESIHAYLPLRVLPTTMRLNLRFLQGQFDFNFGAQIHPLENKKELL